MYSFSFEGVYFEITAFCNRKCPYCYNDSDAFGNYLSKETIYKILDECTSNNVKHITISGGEPFCHPDIYDIIAKMNKLDIKGTFISNLSLVTDDIIRKMLLSGHSFQATLDSSEASNNDITRGKGSYDAVINLLSVAQNCGCLDRIALRFNLSKKNVREIESMINLATDNHMRLLNIALLTKSGRAVSYDGVYDYSQDIIALAQLMAKLKIIKEKYKDMIRIEYSELEEQVGCALIADGEIKLSPKIDPAGNVFLCQLFSGDENSLGNICNETLSGVLHSKKAIDLAEHIRKRKAKQQECIECKFTDFCMCGCPALSYNQTGDLYNKNDQCSMIKFFMKERMKKLEV